MTNPTIALLEYSLKIDLDGDAGGAADWGKAKQKDARPGIGSEMGIERGSRTRVGEIPLRIPKVKERTYFPSLLDPRDNVSCSGVKRDLPEVAIVCILE